MRLSSPGIGAFVPVKKSAEFPLLRTRAGCDLCCSAVSPFHLHCMLCGAPMDGFSASKTCSAKCRATFKRERRRLQSILCWVVPDDRSGKKLRKWLPRRILGLPHTPVCKGSGARRRKKPTGKAVGG